MTDKKYDFIIIGGGPSGSTAATYLARDGFDVLVLEREKFPREHVGESLIPFCYQVFEDLGVLDKMKERFTRKPGATFSNFEGSQFSHWCFNKVIKGPGYLSFHVRRAIFDEMLLNHSEEAGATVLQEAKVLDVELTSEINGVNVKVLNKDGEEVIFYGSFLIDASGQDTFLGKKMKTISPVPSMKPRVAFSTHWEDLNKTHAMEDGNIQIVQLEGDKQGWVWTIPIDENRASIGVVVNMQYFNKQRKILSKEGGDWQKAFYLQELSYSPVMQKITEGGSIVLPLISNGDYSYSVDVKYTDKYAIIGDASAFLDPIFSSGVYLGMRSAQMVSKALVHKIKNDDSSQLDKVYKDIDGGYRLVEALINTFYEEGSIKFSEAQAVMDNSYEKFESAYSILHLILAGDFFTNYEKYLKAIEIMKDVKMIEKFKHLIKHEENRDLVQRCH